VALNPAPSRKNTERPIRTAVSSAGRAKSTTNATAANTATTTQSGSQAGSGSGTQSSTQNADTAQKAAALSSATQVHPENSNLSVRVLSPGNGGSVTQSNTAASAADAHNTAPVTQSATQTGGGGSCGCTTSKPAVQAAGQTSSIEQGALAASAAKQIAPSNSNEPVRIGSWGGDGSVTQSNGAASRGSATNTAPVTQSASQGQAATACGCGGASVQALAQKSDVAQLAAGLSSAAELAPSNTNGPVRIGSYGNDGSVTQSNDAVSHAAGTNTAPVSQTASQGQSPSRCGCSSGAEVQALAQKSEVGQLAAGLSSALQIGASNESGPVRIGSSGNGGSLTQSNTAESNAAANNTAAPTQSAWQAQGGSGVQALGQDSSVGQAAFAASAALQLPGRSRCGCGGSFGNSADPVRIDSRGDDGRLTQSNTASSRADASNTANTSQAGRQTAASACGCSGRDVQSLVQLAHTAQLGKALSAAKQIGASNESGPIRIWSWGGGGSTSQANAAGSAASAPNLSTILQAGRQVMA